MRVVKDWLLKKKNHSILKYYDIIKNNRIWDEYYYLDNNPDVVSFSADPLLHFLLYGVKEGRNPSPHFDVNFYLNRNPDIDCNVLNPLYHYIVAGEHEGRFPNESFDPCFYFLNTPEVVSSQFGCLEHYIVYGKSATQYLRQESEESNGLIIEKEACRLISPPVSTYYEDKKFLQLKGVTKRFRPIAFYLPQFHPTPENDKWWGEGFTEWRNVAKAEKLFKNHHQPRLPSALGYYDLRLKEIIIKQIELAKKSGVEAFCFYYYWFNGTRILDTPLNNFLSIENNDFPYCLCWANENWTKTWDGLEKNVLMQQDYSSADDKDFIESMHPHFKKSNYLTVDNKPLLIIYRPSLFPDMKSTLKFWRKSCREAGIGEIFVAMVQFDKLDPRKFGFDAALEFPPHVVGGGNITANVELFNKDSFTGSIHDYNQMILASDNKVDEGYRCFKSVTMEWDNTARRGERSSFFINVNPKRFERWLKNILVQYKAKEMENELIFINAWNEWAEGTYLEPDLKNGYAYLNAVNKAVYTDSYEKPRIAVVAHIFYADLVDEIIDVISNIPEDFDLFITTSGESYNYCMTRFNALFPESIVSIKIAENRGRDIAPFLLNFQQEYFKYEYVCKIHSKKSLHAGGINEWRQFLYNRLLGSSEQIQHILQMFDNTPKLGLIYPEYSDEIKPFIKWGSNFDIGERFLNNFGVKISNEDELHIAAGSMFWFRPNALNSLISKNFVREDFPDECGQVDGTLQHAIERSFLFLVENEGYTYSSVGLLKDQ